MELIAFEKAHFQNLIDWIVDEETMLKFAGIGFQYPLTIDQLTNYIQKYPERLLYLGVDENSYPIAYGEIIPQDKNSARLGHLLIGESQQRGKGLGKQLIRLLIAEAKNKLDIKVMDLYLLEGNDVAKTCYLNCDFKLIPNDFKIEHKGNSYQILKMTMSL